MNKKIIGVRFKPIGKIFYFDPMEQEFTTDDKVVVETVRGLELGDVVIANKEIDLDEFGIPLKPIIRKATERDIAQKLDNDKRKDEAREIFIQKNEEYGLGMNLLDVDFTLDLNKVIFFFTAEGRVDFRELLVDKMPRIGAIVITDKGKGVVIDRYILKQSLKVELKEGDNVGKVILTFADEVKDTGKIDRNYVQESYTDDDNEDIKNIEGD